MNRATSCHSYIRLVAELMSWANTDEMTLNSELQKLLTVYILTEMHWKSADWIILKKSFRKDWSHTRQGLSQICVFFPVVWLYKYISWTKLRDEWRLCARATPSSSATLRDRHELFATTTRRENIHKHISANVTFSYNENDLILYNFKIFPLLCN